jgi:hypothetical protein
MLKGITDPDQIEQTAGRLNAVKRDLMAAHMALLGVIEARVQRLNIASEASRAAVEEMLAGVYACQPEDETVYELVGPHHNLFLFLTLPLAKGGHATSEELWTLVGLIDSMFTSFFPIFSFYFFFIGCLLYTASPLHYG